MTPSHTHGIAARRRAILDPGAAGPAFGVWRALNPLPAALPAAPIP